MALVCEQIKQYQWCINRRYVLLFLLCASVTVAEIPDNVAFCPEPAITCLALKRFYIIARLEKMCTRFFATPPSTTHPILSLLPSSVQAFFAHTTIHPAIALLTDIAPLIRHEHIRLHVQAAVKATSIQPVHTLWKELCAYRFLGDDLFTQEFCQLIYMAGSRCFNDQDRRQDDSLSAIEQWFATTKAVDPLPGHHAQAIAQRFYLIQRLQRAVKACQKVYEISSSEPEFVIMLKMWDDIQEYKNIETLKPAFDICTSLIALLEKNNPHRLDESTSKLREHPSGLSEIINHADYEKPLNYLASIKIFRCFKSF